MQCFVEEDEEMRAASEQRRRENGTLSPGGGGGGGDSGGAEQPEVEVPLTAAESSDAAIAVKAKANREKDEAVKAQCKLDARVTRAKELLHRQWRGDATFVPAGFSHVAASRRDPTDPRWTPHAEGDATASPPQDVTPEPVGDRVTSTVPRQTPPSAAAVTSLTAGAGDGAVVLPLTPGADATSPAPTRPLSPAAATSSNAGGGGGAAKGGAAVSAPTSSAAETSPAASPRRPHRQSRASCSPGLACLKGAFTSLRKWCFTSSRPTRFSIARGMMATCVGTMQRACCKITLCARRAAAAAGSCLVRPVDRAYSKTMDLNPKP
jgi:hypothetical protein